MAKLLLVHFQIIMNSALIDKICNVCNQDVDALEIVAAEIGVTSRRNELLMIVKPEVFLVSDKDLSRSTLNMMADKMREYKAYVEGVAVLGGGFLGRTGIMNTHYGLVSQLSLRASKILSTDDHLAAENEFHLDPQSEYEVLGGHEFLRTYTDQSIDSLSALWLKAKSFRIRSGVYLRLCEWNGKRIILVNGFHPAQVHHYTHSSSRIVVLVIHSNTDWADLRNIMVGSTFPESARPNSIRGALFASPHSYGFQSATITNNIVHLSAGPFEADFEIRNFYQHIRQSSVEEITPLATRCMMYLKVPGTLVSQCWKNPSIVVNGTRMNLFPATEDMNTLGAIDAFLGGIAQD